MLSSVVADTFPGPSFSTGDMDKATDSTTGSHNEVAVRVLADAFGQRRQEVSSDVELGAASDGVGGSKRRQVS